MHHISITRRNYALPGPSTEQMRRVRSGCPGPWSQRGQCRRPFCCEA